MSAPAAAASARFADVPKRRRRAFAVIVFVVVLDLLGFGIVIPILPFYVRSFVANDVFIGLLAASYSLAQFASAPFLGRISDRYGRRPVIVVSLLGGAVAWTVFGVAGALWLVFVARIGAGAAGGNIATAQAYVADITPPADRAGALGVLGAAFSVGFIVGPALGGVLASPAVLELARGVLPGFVPVTRFSMPSFAAAAISLAGAAVAWRFLPDPASIRDDGGGETDAVPEDAPTGGPAPTTLVSQFRAALADDRLRGLVVAFFLVNVAFSGVTVAFIPWLADVFGFVEPQAAAFLTYIGVLGVVVQGGLVPRVSRRIGDGRMAVVGLGVLAVGAAVLPFTPDIGGFAALAVGGLAPGVVALVLLLPLVPLGNGLLSAALGALVSRSASATEQGSAFGVTQGAGSLGRTVGPPVMAGLYEFGARWSPFVAGAILLVPALVVVARRERRERATAG
ncbi:MFS transporter [Halorubellus sp. JP-L1]|uniref:MFS transporter n=1 Tax=Halorubellus sp. JP-L1 TaxID=2715753 RepID=UPI00140A19A5|nr:MFS transporter [Halorubellus sp. JP-L1]NHN43410.1 MFS transporter [Halorubellus sp. JP-L1]